MQIPNKILGGAAVATVAMARSYAVDKHGPLKPGADRWIRLIGEEWEEAQDELACLGMAPMAGVRDRAIAELAQLAQLCIGVIELLQEDGQTWQTPNQS